MSDYHNGTVQITTTSSLIVSSPTYEDGGILVKNCGPSTVFIGGPSVTADFASTGGVQLAAGETVTVSTTGAVGGDLYGATAVGSAYVSWVFV